MILKSGHHSQINADMPPRSIQKDSPQTQVCGAGFCVVSAGGRAKTKLAYASYFQSRNGGAVSRLKAAPHVIGMARFLIVGLTEI